MPLLYVLSTPYMWSVWLCLNLEKATNPWGLLPFLIVINGKAKLHGCS